MLRLWEGLGYYRRARALHRAARKIVAEHEGIIADNPEMLALLPGLGRYTINAILSQAFDRRVPILEANSRRVLCRLLGIDQDPRRAEIDKLLWDSAEKLLPRRKGTGRFNQALMEVGALICTARKPRCEVCPLVPLLPCPSTGSPRRDPYPPRSSSHRIRRRLGPGYSP